MKLLSHVTSWLFLPLMMPIYALLLVLYVPSHIDFFDNENCMYAVGEGNKLILLMRFFLFCVVFPGISFIIMRSWKIVSTVEMEERKERFIPIVVMFVYCMMLFVSMMVSTRDVQVPKYVLSLPLSGAIVSVVFFFLTMWRKVSIHAAGGGIMVGFLLAYILEQNIFEMWMFNISIVVSGLIMSARLYLERHTFSEVVIGWCTGTFLTFVVNYWY